MPSSKQLDAILQKYRPDLAGPLTLEPISTGKFNRSYKVYAADNTTLVLRVAPPRDAVFVFYERDMMRQEPAIHAQVRAETAVPVPQIFGFDDSLSILERDYMLMECLPGRPLTELPQVNHDFVMFQIGQQLAQVHRLHAEQYGYLGAHRPMKPQTNWLDAFAIMCHKLIDDVTAVGYYDGEEERLLRQLLDKHLPLFDRHIPSSLLHMDVWHQNILVGESGQVTGLLDWDRALWGDPEIEFAVLDYCGISTAAFWEGYGQQRDTSPEAQIRQIFYLLYELQKYIVIRHGRTNDPQGAQRYKEQVFDLVRQTIGKRDEG